MERGIDGVLKRGNHVTSPEQSTPYDMGEAAEKVVGIATRETPSKSRQDSTTERVASSVVLLDAHNGKDERGKFQATHEEHCAGFEDEHAHFK